MNFLRQNIITFTLSFVVTLAVIITSVFMFLSMRDHAVESGTNSLTNEVQTCSNNIVNEIRDFRDDVYFFIANPDFAPLHSQEVPTSSARLRLKNFLAQNRDLLDSLQVYSADTVFTAVLTDKLHLRYRSEPYGKLPEYFDKLAPVEFQYVPEENVVVYKTENRVFVFTTNISRFVKSQFANFYLGQRSYKFVYSDYYGLVPVDHPGDLSEEQTSLLTAEKTTELQQLVEEGTAADFETEIYAADGSESDVLMALYPLGFFGDKYGILFAVQRSEITSNLTGTFMLIGLINLGLVILIVALFARNMGRLNQASFELDVNRSKLEDLVRQQKLLFEYSEDFTYRYDRAGNYDYVSENIQKVLGYTPEEFERSSNRKFTDNPINREARRISELIMVDGQESQLFYVEMLHRNGEPKTLEVKEKPFRNPQGEISGIIGIAKDVTEKFASDQKFRTLFELSTDPHVIYDDNGIIDCNEAAVRILGHENKSDLLGHKPSVFSPERQPDGRLSVYKAEEMDHIAFEKGTHKFEWIHVKRSGEEFPVEVSLTAVTLNHKQVMLTVWHDLTERKRVEHVL